MSIALKLGKRLALVFPAIVGWLLYGAAAWLVHHDSVNYRMRDAGFRFISDAAEMVCAAGAVASILAAAAVALPSTLAYLRSLRSFSTVLALNISAAIVFLCGLGSMEIWFVVLFAVMPFLWIFAMLWVMTQESNQHLQATPR
jgi:hypothetical protein